MRIGEHPAHILGDVLRDRNPFTVKIAITGATGFIGRHVVNALCKYDVDVVTVGRRPVGDDTPGQYRHVIQDLSRCSAETYRDLGKPDILIHLAWSGLEDFASSLHTEQELPLHEAFLGDMLRAGLPCLLVAGTCLEYGMRTGGLVETVETRPVTAYGNAKDTLRRRLQHLQTDLPFRLCWGRIFYPYGEGQAPNSLFPQLRRAAESGEKVFNMSRGDQIRDFLPVENVAAILVELALANRNLGVVNVCSGKPVSVMEQVQRWLKENDWSIELNPGFYPYPEYEPMAFWGDRNKLDGILRGLS